MLRHVVWVSTLTGVKCGRESNRVWLLVVKPSAAGTPQTPSPGGAPSLLASRRIPRSLCRQQRRGGDRMNWEEVGAIGQLLGSVAVFVTLVYLATQVRFARAEYMRSISQ